MKIPKIVSCRKSKNPQIQKVDFFFEKSMAPIKIIRIVLRSFLVLNDQNRNDSVFFKFGRRRAKRGPSEARSVRIRSSLERESMGQHGCKRGSEERNTQSA